MPTVPLPDPIRVDMIRLARCEGIGPVNFPLFLKEYGSAAAAVDAVPERARMAGRKRLPRVPTRAEIEDEIAATVRLGGQMVILGEDAYPLMLAHINDPPPVLSLQGDETVFTRPCVAIVGARQASAAGLTLAEGLAHDLAEAGFCVVSGLALGIDGAAHSGALATGVTAAAIGGGLDNLYPYQHRSLQARIAAQGCVLTEARLGTVPTAQHFPRRNRLIAGVSLGTIIVEAAEKSGTIITARLSLEYGRELFAVPGSPLDPRSRGGNRLLREGATLVESARDVVESLPLNLPASAPPPWAAATGFAEPVAHWEGPPANREEVSRRLRDLLSPVPVTVDELVSRCQFSVSAVMAALAELELGGHAAFVPGGRVIAGSGPDR